MNRFQLADIGSDDLLRLAIDGLESSLQVAAVARDRKVSDLDVAELEDQPSDDESPAASLAKWRPECRDAYFSQIEG
jgi:hypothetical protein